MYLHIPGVEHPIAIPPQLIAQAIQENMPDFLTGKIKAEGKAALLKSGLKAVMPLMLSLGHSEMAKKGAVLPAPDLRSPQARENMILYGIHYILAAVLSGVNGMQFDAKVEVSDDGTIIILDVTPTPSGPALPEANIITAVG